MVPFSLAAQRAVLDSSILEVRSLLSDTHIEPEHATDTRLALGNLSDTGPTVRGLTMVMLFASYEKLLRSTCRALLESAASLRVKTRRLHPGLQLVASFPKLQAASDSSLSKIWTHKGDQVVNTLTSGSCAEINTSSFPDDGSFMKASQVRLFCEVFGLDHPALLLAELWPRLDQVVMDRNAIAHGNATAYEVGRRYTFEEVTALVDLWHLRWSRFLDVVESKGQHRDFYRK